MVVDRAVGKEVKVCSIGAKDHQGFALFGLTCSFYEAKMTMFDPSYEVVRGTLVVHLAVNEGNKEPHNATPQQSMDYEDNVW